MSRGLAFLDRLIVFLFGVVFLAAGLWALARALDPELIRAWPELIDAHVIDSAANWQWTPVILAAATVILTLLGLWLLLVNLRRHTFNKVSSPLSSELGEITLSVGRLAGAVGDGIKTWTHVSDVSHSVAVDRGRPTVTWTITADPSVDLPTLVSELEDNESDVRDALDDVDIDSVYLINLTPVVS